MGLDLRWRRMPKGMKIEVVATTQVPVWGETFGEPYVEGYREVEHYGLFLNGKRLDVTNLMVYPWGGYSVSARHGDQDKVQRALEKAGVKFSVD